MKYQNFIIYCVLFLMFSFSAHASYMPEIEVSRDDIVLGGTPSTPPLKQTFTISSKWGNTLNWRVTSDTPWITVTPSAGTNTGTVTITVDPAGLPEGWNGGHVVVWSPDDSHIQSKTVTVSIDIKNQTQPPFGSFDTPMDGANVRGSVPVTGWVLDDVGVKNVKIYRAEGTDLFYIGDASFVEGARPDVATNYPNYPDNTKAGWGYMLLTNFLPGGGNGHCTLFAVATDVEDKQTTLGSKTILCDNANAVKPFGAIDTPAQGGTASGSSFTNWGWALTPQPNSIPSDGSTIDVLVDGMNVGHPTYNLYRQDLADMFPGYTNSNGAVGYFYLDTQAYSDGVHTIQWTARDDAGNTDGIGSRYFTIQNPDMPTGHTDVSALNYAGTEGGTFKTNSGLSAAGSTPSQTFQVTNIGGGVLNWHIETSEPWIQATPASGTNNDVVTVSVDGTGLPEGEHVGTLFVVDTAACLMPMEIPVRFMKLAASEPPFGEVNRPRHDDVVSGAITVSGWVLDDIGVQSIEVYLNDGNHPVLLKRGRQVKDARPDVAARHPDLPKSDYAGWGAILVTNFLGDGSHELLIKAIDLEGNETILGTPTIHVDNANAVKPFGSIDHPQYGSIVAPNTQQLSGWLLTHNPNAIASDGSTIALFIDGQAMGSPIYNMYRTDIAADLPGYYNSNAAGWFYNLDVTQFEEGVHTLALNVVDNVGNVSNYRQYFVISHTDDSPVSDNYPLVPHEFQLFPVHPNPFNPATEIRFQLSRETHVTLAVYDMLGREVQRLVDDICHSAGEYRILWKGDNRQGIRVASGNYIIKLTAGKSVKTQKAILIQ